MNKNWDSKFVVLVLVYATFELFVPAELDLPRIALLLALIASIFVIVTRWKHTSDK